MLFYEKILDIEEMKVKGDDMQICSYYHSKYSV
jgi:hypothetical protein